jgi:Caspase domain
MKNLNALKIVPFLALSWMMATPLNAQNTYALIVGISQYKEMPALQYADRDAIAFAEFVKGQGAVEDHVKVFLNEEATRLNIVDELYNLSKKAKAGDRFYFYFGGHGDLEAQIAYQNSLLLLYGSLRKNYFQGQEFLQLSELRSWLGTLAQKKVQVVFIADACHSGGLIGGKEGLSKTQQALQESWAGITKILSSQSNEYSLEGKQWGGGRGLFSFHLVNGLKGKADANKNKQVSLGELEQYLKTNVVKEAAPNVQTPLIQGDSKALLAKINELELKKLLDAERLGFPIITEANFKANIEDLLVGLDSSLVGTYKRFRKALDEKRINVFDDKNDYALLHYRTMLEAKVPEKILAVMKRSLAAALLERELNLLKDVRERGAGYLRRNDTADPNTLLNAIQNLQEAQNLLGTAHYFYPLLQSRIWVLDAQVPIQPSAAALSANSTPEQINEYGRMAYEARKRKERSLMRQALEVEPNMISTYSLLSTSYRAQAEMAIVSRDDMGRKLDSALYYQERVAELLPNQAQAHYNLANNYAPVPYTNPAGKSVPHPKAITHFERAIQLDSFLLPAYPALGDLYMGLQMQPNGFRDMATEPAYRNYPRAIACFEKALSMYEYEQQKLIQQNQLKLPKGEGYGPVFSNLVGLANTWNKLYFLYKASGDSVRMKKYLQKAFQRAEQEDNPLGALFIGWNMFKVFNWSEDPEEFKITLQLNQMALQKRAIQLSEATEKDKPLLALKYREQLKNMGAMYAALKNYTEAEKYYLAAIAYSIPPTPILEHLKFGGSIDHWLPNEYYIFEPCTNCIEGSPERGYWYRMDVYLGMFHLKYQQKRVDEAFEWLEKSFQHAVKEQGNETSSEMNEQAIFEAYPGLDQTRFKTLKAKYFPPINAEKK